MRILKTFGLIRLALIAVPPVSRFLQAALSDVAFSAGPQPDWWLDDLAAAFTRWETVQTYRGEVLA